ncbi:ArnT family glycosyltransferase [Actinokineospora terrae]|uniref:4-amino-4-deoxy-L-arabinose transferase n=1 Tax=Actinokineospora terrae TaxID=155974 RepID=A0A1H9TMP2_9PSEU|nr:hypothetical protein [Actinokineospora terrae]SER98435.1 hypothetical protein SAMN04487818_106369 [Actinokineospora terrae]
MTSHRWSVESADRVGVRSVWTAAQARARALDLDILTTAAVLAVAALAAVLRLGALGSPAQAGEGRNVSQVFAVDSLGALLDANASPLAWLQAGGYTALTEAFVRHETALGAAREPMVLFAVMTAILMWVLSRRMGLSRLTGAIALGIAALSPMALGLQLGVRPENVAMPWALAGIALLWTPRKHRRLAPDLWATLFLVIAVITAPVTALLIVTAAWLIWRRRRKRLSLMLASLFVLGTGIGMGLAAGLAGLLIAAEGPRAQEWIATDPLLAAAGLLATLLALFSYRLRPLAVGVLALIAVAVIPGGPGTAALALAVAPAALLVTGVVERATRPPRIPAVILGVVLAATAIPSWVGGLRASISNRVDPEPVADASLWLQENLPTTPVVTDGITWVELVRGGRDPEAARLVVDCPATCSAQSWLVVTPGLRLVLSRRPALAQAAATGQTVAVFGTGDDRVEIHRPSIAGTTDTEEERQARAEVGAKVADSPRIAAPITVDQTLRTGRTDPRLLTTLAALSQTRPVRVTALPEVAGEDAANQPRRQALLTAAEEPADEIAQFFTSQNGVLRPESVTATAEGVLIRYPAGTPAGLLIPFG